MYSGKFLKLGRTEPENVGLTRNVTLVKFVWLFTVCVFKCFLKELGSEQATPNWLHFFVVFKCFLKEVGSKQAKSHWLHLFDFSTLCVFKCFLKELLDLKRQSHIGCIFSTVRFHMFPQIACPNRCKVTMVAFFYFSLLFIIKCFLKELGS